MKIQRNPGLVFPPGELESGRNEANLDKAGVPNPNNFGAALPGLIIQGQRKEYFQAILSWPHIKPIKCPGERRPGCQTKTLVGLKLTGK